jgi:hypothetical protein
VVVSVPEVRRVTEVRRVRRETEALSVPPPP